MITNKFAFTLAETLITITIIGIIAALTIPVLFKNYRAERLRTGFFAASAIVKEVESAMIADKVWVNDLNMEEVKSYFKLGSGEDFRGNPYKNLINKGCQANALILTNGFSIANGMTVWISSTDAGGYSPISYHMLAVDVNGVKEKPNRYGWDVFFWYQDSDGTFVSPGTPTLKDNISWFSKICDYNNTNAENGAGCGYYALTDPNWFKNLH